MPLLQNNVGIFSVMFLYTYLSVLGWLTWWFREKAVLALWYVGFIIAWTWICAVFEVLCLACVAIYLCVSMPPSLDVRLGSSKKKHVNLCNCGCPFKGPSQICLRPFDQALYDSPTLDGPSRWWWWWGGVALVGRQDWLDMDEKQFLTPKPLHTNTNIQINVVVFLKLQMQPCDPCRVVLSKYFHMNRN